MTTVAPHEVAVIASELANVVAAMDGWLRLAEEQPDLTQTMTRLKELTIELHRLQQRLNALGRP